MEGQKYGFAPPRFCQAAAPPDPLNLLPLICLEFVYKTFCVSLVYEEMCGQRNVRLRYA